MTEKKYTNKSKTAYKAKSISLIVGNLWCKNSPNPLIKLSILLTVNINCLTFFCGMTSRYGLDAHDLVWDCNYFAQQGCCIKVCVGKL